MSKIRQHIAKRAKQAKDEREKELREKFEDLLYSQFGLTPIHLADEGIIARLGIFARFTPLGYRNGIQIKFKDSRFASDGEWSYNLHDYEDMHLFFERHHECEYTFSKDETEQYYSVYLADEK